MLRLARLSLGLARAVPGAGECRLGSLPGGIVDLSVGTPVDPTPAVVQDALRAAADAPGYPQTYGTPDAARGRRRLVRPPPRRAGRRPRRRAADDRLARSSWPGCPRCSGSVPGDIVGFPGDRLPHLRRRRPARRRDARGRRRPRRTRPADASDDAELVWLNSRQPHRPGARHRAPRQGRRVGPRSTACVVASDECYAELDWRAQRRDGEPPTTPSILDPRVCGGSHEGLLAVYSLSKQSNLAGYRAAFVAGDPALVGAAARGPQARRDDRAGPGAAGHDRGPGRRRPRRRPEGALPPRRRACSGALSRARASASTTPRPGCTSGRRADEDAWDTVGWLARPRASW